MVLHRFPHNYESVDKKGFPLKILMCLMNEFTHDLRVLKEAKSLVKSGHEVHVLALKDDKTPVFEMIEGIHVQRVYVRCRHKLPKGNLFFLIKYIEYVIRSISQGIKIKPDAVHCHDLNTLLIGMRIRRKLKIPVVYDSHELYLDRNYPFLIHWLWKNIEKYGIKRADKVFVENPSRGKILEERYGIAGTVPLRNCQYLQVEQKNDRLHRELKLEKHQKIVLYQGVITKARGMDQLLNMIQLLPENIHLVIIGDGAYIPEIQKRIEKEHIKRVHFLGLIPLKELPSYTASADIGISLIQNINKNHYYALSNKIFEYMSAGLPVVFSDFPEMHRVITEEKAGFVINETSPAEAANAVVKILLDEELYQKMSRNALNAVRNTYNWEKEVKVLTEYYDSISTRN